MNKRDSKNHKIYHILRLLSEGEGDPMPRDIVAVR